MGDFHGTESPDTGVVNRPAPSQLKPGPTASGVKGPLYMQTSDGKHVLVRRLKRKEDGTWKHFTRWFVENQISLSSNLLALLMLCHNFIPKARSHTHKYFQLAYYNGKSGQYAIGFDDTYVIIFCIVLFTLLRAGFMEYVLAPFARMQGVTKKKDQVRFTEQAWLLVYYSVFWTMGAYIYCKSPYFFNMRELWTDWPNREMDGLMKGYILAQWAFWLQQIIVINIEERRKDHWQMFSHHIITISLISSCYYYHHTRVGNLILIVMDVVDLFLPMAKCLKYAGYNTICDIMFGVFMTSWLLARHVLYLAVCWSVYSHTPEIMPAGCFRGTNEHLIGPEAPPPGLMWLIEPYISSTGRVCYNETVKWAFLAPLLALQGITIVWFTMIVRVAMKVLRGDGAEDSRSDDEAVEEEEDEYIYEEAELLEEEVGADEIDLRGWERRSGVKRQASSSGVSLPGHSDRKELLGRIGCEKQVD
ncbi:Sphingosine N-acyltransferase lag1 [Conoideocrella luteorostrata]|uniref:Sphingosine N-acyltransferase lag1 n=1 Tax=Conoideocrella luteorostrata TaxID=1105319 RepID=A0AAJ0CKM1_9HYPO|nr:Sphingosine N-acyltransferase lag1 [Conoideocrella luteorostrata]